MMRVVAEGQFQDELVRPGKLRRFDDRFQRHAWVGQRDVLAHAPPEQYVLLQHHTDLPSQPGGIDHRKIDTIHQHAAGFGHVQCAEPASTTRALARAGSTDNTHHFARPQRPATDSLIDLGAIGGVTKASPDPALCGPVTRGMMARWLSAMACLDRRIENLAQLFDRNPGLLQILPKLHDPRGSVR